MGLLVTKKSHTNEERSKIYKDYRAKKGSTGPLRTYHHDKGTNSVEETALSLIYLIMVMVILKKQIN